MRHSRVSASNPVEQARHWSVSYIVKYNVNLRIVIPGFRSDRAISRSNSFVVCHCVRLAFQGWVLPSVIELRAVAGKSMNQLFPIELGFGAETKNYCEYANDNQ